MVHRSKFLKMMNVGKKSERCRKDVGKMSERMSERCRKASSFHSRSSVFRILNKYNIKLNRGKHSGPIKKKGKRKNSQNNNGDDNQ